jgi:hypothetical protein
MVGIRSTVTAVVATAATHHVPSINTFEASTSDGPSVMCSPMPPTTLEPPGACRAATGP